MRQVGLLFGSFNPVHVGHLALANYMLVDQQLDEVWLVVSPLNPFKDEKSLIDSTHRLKMVQIALGDHSKIKACDVELHLPLPSYTIDTLAHLAKQHPGCRFSIIMGADNLLNIERWKESATILANHRILVYPRPGSTINIPQGDQHIVTTQAPLFEISSTFIRHWAAHGKDITFFVPHGVAEYLLAKGLFKD